MRSFARVETRRLLLAAIVIAAAAGVCNVLDKVTWSHARFVSHVFGIAGFILFWVSYIVLWAILVLGPFRPRTEFSLRGECGARASNFFLALGGLLLLHLWMALIFALAFR